MKWVMTVGIALLLGTVAWAEQVSYEFDGNVDQGQWREVGQGASITGRFDIDLAMSAYRTTETQASYQATKSLTMLVGAATFAYFNPAFAWTMTVNPDYSGFSDAPIAAVLDGSTANLDWFASGTGVNNGMGLDQTQDMDTKPYADKRWGLVIYDQDTHDVYNIQGKIRNIRKIYADTYAPTGQQLASLNPLDMFNGGAGCQ